jgi:hypothetical protein
MPGPVPGPGQGTGPCVLCGTDRNASSYPMTKPTSGYANLCGPCWRKVMSQGKNVLLGWCETCGFGPASRSSACGALFSLDYTPPQVNVPSPAPRSTNTW